MNSRIDKLLCLRNGGLVVDAQGPITLWDPDEESAVVSIVITQVKANGTTAVATGSSGHSGGDGDDPRRHGCGRGLPVACSHPTRPLWPQ